MTNLIQFSYNLKFTTTINLSVNFSNADYLERRRLVDDTPLVSNASNNRKILADIFGEPGKLLPMNFSLY